MNRPATLTITVDGRTVACAPGETVLQAARRVGVEIPTLCHDDRLEPAGCCRSCLVEVEGQRRLQPACAWAVAEGLAVRTDTARVARHRRVLGELYLADHGRGLDAPPADGLIAENRLLGFARTAGAAGALPACDAPRHGRDDPNPYIHFDPDLCIACARCVRYCDEVEGVSAITLAGRGAEVTIATPASASLLDTTCELCGGCVDTCPTGAMREKKPMALALPADTSTTTTRTTCTYCGVGCQLDLHVVDDRIVKVTSPPVGTTHNDGNLCIKGRFAYDFVHHPDRLTTPLVRGADGALHPATWDEALDRTARGLLSVRERFGPDALGFVSSSRCTGEENYMVQKLARAAFGTNNCHQCAAT